LNSSTNPYVTVCTRIKGFVLVRELLNRFSHSQRRPSHLYASPNCNHRLHTHTPVRCRSIITNTK